MDGGLFGENSRARVVPGASSVGRAGELAQGLDANHFLRVPQ